MSGKIRLKRASGWFAAGREWQRALELLSDGAFKLFVYVSLEAERGTRRLNFHQRDLAAAASPGSSRAPRAGAKVAQAKAGHKTETR